MNEIREPHIEIFNKRQNFNELHAINYKSRIGLYISKLLLFVGFLLIIFDNAGYVTSGIYFGKYNWTTASVFIIGASLCLLFVPYLYFSSFKKFKNRDEYWDQELSWILPIFFFATFFQYGSGIFFMLKALVISFSLILIIHIALIFLSHRVAREMGDYEKHDAYFESMKYLSLYYILIFLVFFFLNPIELFRSWMGYP